MEQQSLKLDSELDMDQKKILFVYSLYSNEEEMRFIQYTAILVACYYLMKQGLFPNYKEQLLIYDYKNSRRYLWEDKKFMNDINVLRAKDTLIRARVRSQDYRDVNSHQCSKVGIKFLEDIKFFQSIEGKAILKKLMCKCKNIMNIYLEDDGPYLRCLKCDFEVFIKGFLYDLHEPFKFPLKPFFLGGVNNE